MMDVSEAAQDYRAEAGLGSESMVRMDHSNFTPSVEEVDTRTTKLVEVVAHSVIPELLAKFEDSFALSETADLHAGEEDIVRLASIVIGTEDADSIQYVESLRQRGLSLDLLHQELLEPTARRLGDLWNDDLLDFLDVTIGVARLQRMVHFFARLDQIPPYDEMRRVLLVQTPGEAHSFGIAVVQRFLTAGGWNVRSDANISADEIEQAVAQEWFGVVGFSLAGDTHVDQLTDLVAQVRKASRNPTVGIMVGGPAFSADSSLVYKVGADGMATNGPSAVVLAKKLLAASLAPRV